jgi:hypothetical protein
MTVEAGSADTEEELRHQDDRCSTATDPTSGRGAFPTSTRVPNRNWFVVVTRDEFVVVRLGWWWLRSLCIAERVPRTLLRPDVAPTLKRRCTSPTRSTTSRVGHANASLTLNVYAHVLRGGQTTAAALAGSIVHDDRANTTLTNGRDRSAN